MRYIYYSLPLATFIILGVFLYKGIYKPSISHNMAPEKIHAFPSFNLPSLNNPETTLSEKNIRGVPALVNIWASWCFSCKLEHEFLINLAKQGVRIYGINYKDHIPKARTWLHEKGNPYFFNIVLKQGTLAADLGLLGTPETFLIDEKGLIHFHHLGALDPQSWQNNILPLYDKLMQKAIKHKENPAL